ncbi:S-layer homology domain-containing protein [Mastigocladopsis repens]|uniref:S-layer homology domain-containing protein n=1 Tax=Mastigocladopsis repens TaxID=221287 RepID=UPI0002EA602E|nr:S-layer homology domain-containing protein [Mastigocladopsis repens]
MNKLLWFLSLSVSLATLCLAVLADAPIGTYAQTSTPTTFPDVKPSYWAQPFIQGLAERNILNGYPDGTFRPQQVVNRDEFAAIINKAFQQPPRRQIASGSVYKDVPANYWAAPPIKAAYQQGFMTGYPGGFFRPNQDVTKVEAIVALSKGLNLASSTTPAATTQATKRQTKRRFVFFPLAITTLMQPLLIPRANATATPPSAAAPQTRNNQAANLNRPASFIITNSYADANKIPQYAVGDVASATKSNIVVNYPNRKILNPTKPATRGEIAALIYQTMVAQGRVKPIAINLPAYQYVVRPQSSNKNTQ